MPYNYLDFIRDEYRKGRGRTPSATRYRGININPKLGQGDEPYGSFRGEPLGPKDSGSTGNTGNVILGRVGFGQTEGALREDAATFNRPRHLYGSGITPTEYRSIYGREQGAYNPTPARQAAASAVNGNLQLNDGDARAQAVKTGQNVLSASGATYFPNGGFARIRPVNESVKDFSNPVLSPERAADYLTNGPVSANALTNNYSGPASVIAPQARSEIPTVPSPYRPAESPKPTNTSAVNSFGVPTLSGVGNIFSYLADRGTTAAKRLIAPFKKEDENQY